MTSHDSYSVPTFNSVGIILSIEVEFALKKLKLHFLSRASDRLEFDFIDKNCKELDGWKVGCSKEPTSPYFITISFEFTS